MKMIIATEIDFEIIYKVTRSLKMVSKVRKVFIYLLKLIKTLILWQYFPTNQQQMVTLILKYHQNIRVLINLSK